jgi:hypothetical protein
LAFLLYENGTLANSRLTYTWTGLAGVQFVGYPAGTQDYPAWSTNQCSRWAADPPTTTLEVLVDGKLPVQAGSCCAAAVRNNAGSRAKFIDNDKSSDESSQSKDESRSVESNDWPGQWQGRQRHHDGSFHSCLLKRALKRAILAANLQPDTYERDTAVRSYHGCPFLLTVAQLGRSIPVRFGKGVAHSNRSDVKNKSYIESFMI